jgi:hypothetical protein
MHTHSDTWLRRFAKRGYPAAKPLGAGMEGAVYRLDEDLVAKVWGRKGEAELTAMRVFYEQLAAIGLDFATPRFLELWEAEGLQVTIEPRLPGVPLDSVCPPDRPPQPEAVTCMLDVLDGLRSAGDLASAHVLPVLGEPRAMWEGAPAWPAALQGLLDRRLARFDARLRARIPRFGLAVERLRVLIAELTVDDLAVLHGDLIPANVLVDDALRPVAVLDFGFFTTVGDPAFDLAVTASIFDMYGPRARQTEAEIDRAAAERFGFTSDRLALYRAVYALATANVYDPNGRDGHFRWCAETIGRDDVATPLGIDSRRGGSEA